MTDHLDDILNYVYRFRYLSRSHFQSFLHHKNHRLILSWLNQLSKEGFLKRDYNQHDVITPAIYTLGLQGRKFIKDNLGQPIFKDIKESLLDRVWKKQSLQFKKHCLFVATIYLSLITLTKKTGTKLNFKTQTDLYGMKYLILPYPDCYFSIEEKNGQKKYFFLDIFDELPPRMELRKRVRQYFEYFENGYWQDHAKVTFPNIILVVPDERSKNYLFKKIQEKLEDESDINFYLVLREDIYHQGLNRRVLLKIDL